MSQTQLIPATPHSHATEHYATVAQASLTKQQLLEMLCNSEGILEPTLDAALPHPHRLHDLIVSCEALTPGETRREALGVDLHWGEAKTPFGAAQLAWTTGGLSYLVFKDNDIRLHGPTLENQWPKATLIRDDAQAQTWADRVFERLHPPQHGATRSPLPLLLRGTNFQIKVWEALLRVPPGKVVTYSRLARAVGEPAGARAVGTAMGANLVAVLIPCHRVIRESGELGNYHWGVPRKAALLAWEAATTEPTRQADRHYENCE
jgi:AraC family transcriptional regulator of adaptative response/methylated-DNA-[protein]-cysteine methyltransferase